jgi:hypothetical protein
VSQKKRRRIKEFNVKDMYRAVKKKHWIFKICVSIPHNYPLIMGDRHKNFEDSMFFLNALS